jgi:hypothetical protein
MGLATDGNGHFVAKNLPLWMDRNKFWKLIF